MLEQILGELLPQLPNLAVALAALYWTATRIDKMIDAQQTLVQQLLQLCAQHQQLVETISSQRQQLDRLQQPGASPER